MRSKIKVLALLLAIMMFLCACDFSSIPAETGTESSTGTETTVDSGTEIQSETESETELETESETEASTYRQSISRDREELEAMLTISDEDFTEAESLLVEFEEMALSSTDVEAINAISEEFEEKYDFVATQISIASVIYYLDMSDEEASARYLDNYDKYGDMYNSYMAHCKKVYEESPVRDELFADWTEEEIKMLLNFSPETTALTIRNEEITDEINNLSAGEFKDKSAELYAELVTNYNKIAKLYGYDNYYDYATKEIYGRDFGQEELEYFSKAVAEQYLPKYSLVYTRARSNISMLTSEDRKLFNGIMYGKFDGLETNYLVNYINSLDGSMKEGMEHIFINRNMVFSNAKNSHPTAFQTYFDSLEMPFCLFGSEGQSTMTMVHEIGHYYSSLYNSTLVSYDLAEVQSQGNEMLLLNYMKGNVSLSVYKAMKSYQMYSSMSTIVSSVIIDEFERAVYSLDSVEGFGSEEFDAIMSQVCEKFGGEKYVREQVGDVFNYWRQVATNNPVYYISYAVSATAAINICAELDVDTDSGREMYRAVVEDVSEEDTFLTALAKAGIASPFTDASTEKILATMLGN